MYLEERVVANFSVGNPAQGIYKLVLSGRIALAARPGQFVHIRVADTHDPLLRRPLSLAGIDREREEVTIFYRVTGQGTELLAGVSANEQLSVLGPLGTGFTVPAEGELLLLAGGIGVFPLYSLLQACAKTKVKVKLLWGGENQQFLASAGFDYLQSLGADFEVSTLDGSLGKRGMVTDLLEKYLKKDFNISRTLLRAAACGPKGMLEAVAAICKREGIPLEVSLEERMACGLGACLGCVCTVLDEKGELKRKRVCKEGPVFDGKEVVWDADT